jgi:Spy/CpxP family protein refolding chaperone
MMSSGCRRVLHGLLLLAATSVAYAQPRPSPPASAPPAGAASAGPSPGLWWKNDEFRKQLGLSDPQVQQIDKIYKDARGPQEGRMAELNRLEHELSVLIKKNDPIEKVTIKVDQVESMRAAMNKGRTLMLYEMRRVMTDSQRLRFDELHAEWRKAQKREQEQQQSRKDDPKSDRRSDSRSRF